MLELICSFLVTSYNQIESVERTCSFTFDFTKATEHMALCNFDTNSLDIAPYWRDITIYRGGHVWHKTFLPTCINWKLVQRKITSI
jgi:hypothetical protein